LKEKPPAMNQNQFHTKVTCRAFSKILARSLARFSLLATCVARLPRVERTLLSLEIDDSPFFFSQAPLLLWALRLALHAIGQFSECQHR
jgi:hypothetical protein